MIALWNNKQVHEVLRKQKIVLEDSGLYVPCQPLRQSHWCNYCGTGGVPPTSC